MGGRGASSSVDSANKKVLSEYGSQFKLNSLLNLKTSSSLGATYGETKGKYSNVISKQIARNITFYHSKIYGGMYGAAYKNKLIYVPGQRITTNLNHANAIVDIINKGKKSYAYNQRNINVFLDKE